MVNVENFHGLRVYCCGFDRFRISSVASLMRLSIVSTFSMTFMYGFPLSMQVKMEVPLPSLGRYFVMLLILTRTFWLVCCPVSVMNIGIWNMAC